jgi:hypothetical protein
MALNLAQLRARQGAARDEAKDIKKGERENGRRVVLRSLGIIGGSHREAALGSN